MIKKWYNIKEIGQEPKLERRLIMRGLGQKDDTIDVNWREVDVDDSQYFEDGFTFSGIIGVLKKMRPKKMTKGTKVIATVWRGINWFIVWRIICRFITFLFKDTLAGVVPYVFPGIPWSGALKMIAFFFALNVAFNASTETNKDDFRFACLQGEDLYGCQSS